MQFLNLVVVGLYYFGKRNIWNALVIFVLVGITGLAFLQSTVANGGVDGAWWSGMWQNFATEMIGAIMTFALFEILINANNRQETLVRQMASTDRTVAMYNIKVDETTILPDGQYWSTNSDWSQFTVSQATQKIKRPQSHYYRQLRAKRRPS